MSVRERACESVRECVSDRGYMRVCVRYRAGVSMHARACVSERVGASVSVCERV